jgi:hypothetical protein
VNPGHLLKADSRGYIFSRSAVYQYPSSVKKYLELLRMGRMEGEGARPAIVSKKQISLPQCVLYATPGPLPFAGVRPGLRLVTQILSSPKVGT